VWPVSTGNCHVGCVENFEVLNLACVDEVARDVVVAFENCDGRGGGDGGDDGEERKERNEGVESKN
jgi:hypothetical protein